MKAAKEKNLLKKLNKGLSFAAFIVFLLWGKNKILSLMGPVVPF